MIALLLRCIIIYALLVAALRLTGKRQMGELEISELITTLILSEVAVAPISDPDIPVLNSILPVFALSAFEVIVTFFTSKSPKLRSIIAGRPNAVIKDGEIDQDELKKLRLSAAELMAQLRVAGSPDPSKLQYAFFEEDGQLSVVEKDSDYIFSLICDGKLHSFNIREAGWSEERVKSFLDRHNTDISQVFLMTLDQNGKISIIYKEE